MSNLKCHAGVLFDKDDGGSLFLVDSPNDPEDLAQQDPGRFERLSAQAAGQRLAEFKRQIQSGAKTFEQLARDNSEDGSAAQGGELGWTSPGAFVPEFEEAMNGLQLNGLSEPVVSRFGVHLIQVLERRQITLDLKQQREQARNVLREQKFEEAYLDWVRDLRGRAYVELREAPQ